MGGGGDARGGKAVLGPAGYVMRPCSATNLPASGAGAAAAAWLAGGTPRALSALISRDRRGVSFRGVAGFAWAAGESAAALVAALVARVAVPGAGVALGRADVSAFGAGVAAGAADASFLRLGVAVGAAALSELRWVGGRAAGVFALTGTLAAGGAGRRSASAAVGFPEPACA